MSKSLNIQGKIVEFPTSAQSPNWGPALTEFAEAVEAALSGLAGTYDVPPQAFTITSDDNDNVELPLLAFPTAYVRGAFIRYTFHRSSNTNTEVETGTLEIVYNTQTGSWQMSREAVGTDDCGLTFNVTNQGQVRFSTAPIGGVYSTGSLTYIAQAMLKTT